MLDDNRLSFKRIVCPVELSPDSSQALRYAFAFASSYHAKLFVLHCTATETNAEVTDRAALRNIVENFTHEYMLSPTAPALDCESVIVSGEPDVEIAREAAERQADLIIMRSRRRPYAAALLGSVAESVCRMAPCPTLVTHAREIEWAGRTANSLDLKRVLVAYDFSSDSELALSYGLSFAQQYGAELHVLHVVPSRPKVIPSEISQLPFSSESTFRKTFAALKTAVPHSEVGGWSVRHAVREGQPYREVLAYAEDQAVELICMGASGTGFGMRALFGSNADRVLRQAPCPILIARPLRPAIATPVNEPLRTEASAAFAHEAREVIQK
ncbi:MAG TPA: universal stress protein [Blastocatellia bacterium]|jgi:nucleotide-binding universal stress UspA family protein|nr:universal stress protein [Blastocatellia bacterium]